MALLPSTNQHVLIVGGGIAGLSTAIVLAQLRIRVTIVEKRKEFASEGAGIQLGPNATKCLAAMGIARFIRSDIVEPVSIKIGNMSSNEDIAALPLGQFAREQFGSPYWTIRRQDLQQGLLKEIESHSLINIIHDATLLDSQQHLSGYAVLCGNEKHQHPEFSVQAIIGADGVFSALRQQFFPKKKPIYSGYVAWRGIVDQRNLPTEFSRQEVKLLFGKGCHFVGYPIDGGNKYNCVIVTGCSKKSYAKNPELNSKDLIKRLGKLSAPLKELMSNNPVWSGWQLHSGISWSAKQFNRLGKMTLVGDAVHPVLPFLAQGGAFAIEDAMVLKDELMLSGQNSDGIYHFEKAFRNYEKRRLARWQKLTKAAQKNKLPYHAYWPISDIRNIIIRMQSGKSLLKKYDWLYAWSHDAKK